MTTFSVGSVISRSFRIFQSDLLLYTGLTFLVYVPLLLVTGGVVVAMQVVDDIDPDLMFALFGGGYVVAWGYALIASPVATAAVIHGVFRRLNGTSASFSECVQTGMSRFGAVLAYSVLSGIAIVLGYALCVVPGIILTAMWYVGLPAVVVEKKDAIEAFRRSDFLTGGERWGIFGLLVLVVVLNYTLSIATSFLAIPLGPDLGMLSEIGSQLVSIAVTALGSVFVAVSYHDLRVAKEGIASSELASVFD